jgi:hypothetical protein
MSTAGITWLIDELIQLIRRLVVELIAWALTLRGFRLWIEPEQSSPNPAGTRFPSQKPVHLHRLIQAKTGVDNLSRAYRRQQHSLSSRHQALQAGELGWWGQQWSFESDQLSQRGLHKCCTFNTPPFQITTIDLGQWQYAFS